MARSKNLPPLTESQLEIMNLVWDRGELTVGEVLGELSQRREVTRNTIQTMMTRLEERGWLRHRAAGKTFYYRAAIPQRKTQRHLVRRLIDSAFGGSAEGLVMALLENGVSDEEALRIQHMIDQSRTKTE